MELALKLRELRKEKGLTQTELAKRSGLATSCISMIEIGQREANAHTITVLAQALETTTDYLLGLEDELGNILSRQSYDLKSDDEKKLLYAFRLLDQSEKETFLIQINAIAKEKLTTKK